MIRAIVISLLLALSSVAHAGRVAMKPPPSVSGSPGSRSSNGPVAANQGQFSDGFTIPVGGQQVTVPADWRFAANAPQFAAQAAKLNPTRLAVGVVAVWLAEKGLQYVDGQWQKYVEGLRKGTCHTSFGPDTANRTGAECIALVKAAFESLPASNVSVTPSGPNPDNHEYQTKFTRPGGFPEYNYSARWSFSVETPPQLSPATDADWTPAQTDPLPDPVINALTQKGVSLPLENPQISHIPQDVPLSDPYTDPTTGERVQDVAHVRPQSDESAQIDVTKRQVDANGNPATDPNTNQPKPEESNPDFCVEHPDVLSCQKLGDTPADPDITANDKTITINPDTGWGPSTGSCPADHVETLRNGAEFRVSYAGPCQIAASFRPVVIGFSWIAAILIAIGITKRYG